MSLTFSGSREVCWLGLKIPDTSLASSLFVAMPAQPVRPSLLWMASLSSAAMCEPNANLGWSLAHTSAPGQEKKNRHMLSVVVKTWHSLTESKSKLFMWWETESAMQIFYKFKLLGLFHNSFPGFHEPDVRSYTLEAQKWLTEMVVDVSLKWKVVRIWCLCQPCFYHFCDVHEVFVKSKPLYQWTVGHQQLWMEDKRR